MAGLGRYTLVRKIAEGGMASIYLGIQHGAASFQRPVVIKAIRAEHSADPHFRDTLIDEAHIAMSLNHSNIVQVLDLGASSGRYFLILELVDGWDLDQILRRAEKVGLRLPPALALYITGEVCRALGYAHAKTRGGKPLGIVHRDVSPHNVLLSEQGEVKLTDFGIATASEKRERTFTGVIKGKLGFMSPEQAAGEPLDGRSDLFALGAILYLMATGKRPFDAPTELESLLRTKEARFPPPDEADEDIDNDLANLVLRAMRREREDRFASAEEMLEACERVQRTSFEAAGATELKRWLTELSRRDGSVPVTRLSAPPVKVEEEDIVADQGALVLSEVQRGAPPPPPREGKRKGPPPPPEPTPRATAAPPAPAKRSRGVLAVGLLGAAAVGGAWWLHQQRQGAPTGPAQVTVAAVPEDAGRAEPAEDSGSPTSVAAADDAGAIDAGALSLASADAGEVLASAADAGAAVALAAMDAGVDGGAATARVEVDAGAAVADAEADAGAAVGDAEADAGEPEAAEERVDARAPASRPRVATVERADAGAPHEVVRVNFVTDPPGATVRVDRKTFGSTPVSVRFRSGIFYNVVFTLGGFAPAERKIYVSDRHAEQGVKVKLKR